MVSAKSAGLRGSAVIAPLPTAAIGATFGVLAAPVIGAVPTVLMSALVWSGTAQFSALTVLSGGGGAAVAASSGLSANARYLPMGFALAPSLHAPMWRRAATGALLADASFAIAHRDRGGFDPQAVAWAAPLQYAGWVGGTVAGAAGAAALADPERFGVDVLFAVFYLALLLPELRGSARTYAAAALSAAVTMDLVPITPSGVPIVVAAATALIGLRSPS